MDQSLDDIIKEKKIGFRGRGRGRGGAKRGGSGGARGTKVAGRQSGRGGGFSSPRGGRGGRVQKRGNYSRGPMPDVWQHDKFADDGSGRRAGSAPARGGMGKLLISNLDYGVNDTDINELFAEFGPLKKAAVHYDKSGRSLATAEVWYERQSDAAKAMKQYNNVPLDGRPMSIQMVGGGASRSSSIPASATTRLGGGFGGQRRTSQQRGRGGGRGGGARGRGGRGRGKKPTPTAEDLDAELDAYRNQMDTA